MRLLELKSKFTAIFGKFLSSLTALHTGKNTQEISSLFVHCWVCSVNME